ncbi:MAG: hypothetical protein IPM48_12085 [Saprospiraceae bacterium]|nr:hypothetical protein [Saprospiraceae bacterium]
MSYFRILFNALWFIFGYENILLGQSVNSSKPVYAPGENIVVNFSGFSGASRDWVGLAAKGLADDKYTSWQYTGGAISGTLTFNGLPYGDYEVRGYFNDGGVVKARSYFRVGNTDQNLVAKTEKTSYKPNEKIKITFSGFPGNARDWIGIAVPGSSDEKYVIWAYTNGQQSGIIEFQGLADGNYEVRSYFNNEGIVRSRYSFSVSNTVSANPTQLCRAPLSVFFAGMTGLGAAWGRTTCEPTIMSAIGISDIQATLRNAKDGMDMLRDCFQFNSEEISQLINRIPNLTNVQAEQEIHLLVRKLQEVVVNNRSKCHHQIPLSSLYVAGVHLGAAQAHASCQQCQLTPMPMAIQTVIRNHLNTARDAFSAFLPCVPSVTLNQFNSIQLGSMNSLVAHTEIVGLHTNLLWNISLSDCCCECR